MCVFSVAISEDGCTLSTARAATTANVIHVESLVGSLASNLSVVVVFDNRTLVSTDMLSAVDYFQTKKTYAFRYIYVQMSGGFAAP